MGLEVNSVWEPYTVLDLDPNVRNTCVGRAPTRGDNPCRLPVCLRDRKLACNALNTFARSPWTVTPQSLENLACLLLCKRYHQYQISEVVTKWTKQINDFYNQDRDMKTRVSQTHQLQDNFESAERQAREDRQETKAVNQLLLELTQRDREAETLRGQLSKSLKAEEEALQVTAEAERVSQDLSIQLAAWKCLATKATDQAKELRSENESLADKLCSRNNLQQQLASAHATLNSRNQQLALKEETVSKTKEELTSARELARTTQLQLTSQTRDNLQTHIEASSTIAELLEDVLVLHSRKEAAERRIAADDKLFSALRLGMIRVGVFIAFVGALHMLSRL